jgi:serine/threonine protein kinase
VNPRSPRIQLHGASPYPHEQEAIDHAIGLLPDAPPYNVWALAELLDPATGRLHEIDLLVLGYAALYLVEIKSGPGLYEGDAVDWRRTPDGEPSRYMEPPLRLTNTKAKILKSRLRARMKNPAAAPWVEPLVFLSHPETRLALSPEGRTRVVTRDTLLRALQHHEFPGADERARRNRISAPDERDIIQALASLGLRPRKDQAHAGPYQLGELLEDGPGYQDRVAVHRHTPRLRRRARIYLVPSQTSAERRQRLLRAADREALLLDDLREHPGVLRFHEYIDGAEPGPTVLFDEVPGAVRLDAFLRQNPLDLYERVSIIEQVGRALEHCHRKGITHGALGPEAVLARRHPDTGAIEARLYNFQLGAGADVDATSHWSLLAAEPWALYQAPELRDDPTNRTPQADIFSLGALAYFVLTGRAPGASIAEVEQHLARRRCLDPTVADDTIPRKLAEIVGAATQLRFADRYDSAGEWVELLLAEITRPAAPESAEATQPAEPDAPSPLEAQRGDLIGGDLLVHGVLGHGASARVLLVEREADGRELALKISLSPDHDERLAEEAAALARLHHSRIVQLVEIRQIGGRPCLLLTLAGTETLHRLLAREGSIGLDYASRFGEDLLFALEYLEEQQVMHRDIKPANLGAGMVANKAQRLILFDFSLVGAPSGNVALGTAAYRDPFLRLRSAWDPAADRWSAAVTLHEMLTGVRPGFGDRGGTALDDQAELRLAAERFDPAVRERLIEFFQKALARDVEARFAEARDMRRAWNECFSAPREAGRPRRSRAVSHADDLDDNAIAAIAPDTAIEALPLSVRARNALDRAGLARAEDLLSLADNRLSAIRGIGTQVAREILGFRDRWRGLRALTAAQAQPFFPGYRGDDAHVAMAGPGDPDAASELARWTGALVDAGLHTLAAVAAAPAHQLDTLARRHGLDIASLRGLLERENRRADERDRPSTIEGWLAALLPGRAKGERCVRALYGLDLDGPFAGRIDATPRQVAETLGVTRAYVYLTLDRCRERWAKHRALGELTDLGAQILATAGGAMPLGRAADELAGRIPHDRAVEPPVIRARAAALLRIVAEVEREDQAGLRYVRLRDDAPWLLASEAHADVVRALGDAADELAQRPVLASPGEAHRVLADIVTGTSLAGLSPGALPGSSPGAVQEAVPEALIALAVTASRAAARSARLEIYPRGMLATRALELSTAVLTGNLTPAEVRERVLARYPEAEPLPEHPALEPLLEPHGLRWIEARSRYERTNDLASSHHTLFTPEPTALRTPAPRPIERLAEGPSAGEIERDTFEQRMRSAIERAGLRILGVTADRAADAAVALGRAFGLQVVSFDQLFTAELHRQMAARSVRADIYQADREGPASSKSWTGLTRLATLTAEAVAASLFPPRAPLLLTQPGLIARYRLDAFLTAMVAASQRDDAAALFLLVPAHDTGGIPRINGEREIPGILPSQSLWIPRPWIARSLKQP